MAYVGQLQYRVNTGQLDNDGTIKYITNCAGLIEGDDLIGEMKAKAGVNVGEDIQVYIIKLSIQAPPGTEWTFTEEGNNNKSFYIGTTGIYEIDKVKLLGLKFKRHQAINKDITAQYIAYDNSIRALEEAESERIENLKAEKTTQDYINAQRTFYEFFLKANQNYDKAFKGLYWDAGIIDPENIIIDYFLQVGEDNQ